MVRWAHIINVALLIVVAAGIASGQSLVDITQELGIVAPPRMPLSGEMLLSEKNPGEVITFDFDSDGDLDILITYGPQSNSTYVGRNRLYLNTDDGWIDKTRETGLAFMPPAVSAAVGDYNHDGYPDIYLCTTQGDRLLRNIHGDYLEDVTEKAGIANPYWASRALFLDANGDGHLDIYVANFIDYPAEDTVRCTIPGTKIPTFCDPILFPGAENKLFIQDTPGHFSEAADIYGLTGGVNRATDMTLFDANLDGQLDIFIISHDGPNQLFVASEFGPYGDIAFEAGVAFATDGSEPGWLQVMAEDFNHDGAVDLALTSSRQPLTILLNNGRGRFFDGFHKIGLFKPRRTLQSLKLGLADMDMNGQLELFYTAKPTDHDTLESWIIEPGKHYFIREVRGLGFVENPIAVGLTLNQTKDIPRMPPKQDAQDSLNTMKLPLDFSPLDAFIPELNASIPAEIPAIDSTFGEKIAGEFFDEDIFEALEADSVSVDSLYAGVADSVVAIREVMDSLSYYQPYIPDDVIMEAVELTESVWGYHVADINGNGKDELLIMYPSGELHVLVSTDEGENRHVGLYLNTAIKSVVAEGALITLMAKDFQVQYRVTTNLPKATYIPPGIRSVDVEVLWPDGAISTHGPLRPGQYYMLRREERIR